MIQRPSEIRIRESVGRAGVGTFTVACLKHVTKYSVAVKKSGNEGKLAVCDFIARVLDAMDLDAQQCRAA